MSKVRQLRDDILVQPNLARDPSKALNRLGQRSGIQLLETGDAEAPHLPLAVTAPPIPPNPIDAQVMVKQQGSQLESRISVSLAVMDALSILKADTHDSAFPPTEIGTP